MRNRILTTGISLLSILLYVSCNQPVKTFNGQVEEISMYSEVLKREVAYNIYNAVSKDSLVSPKHVLYLLHGHGGDHQDWFQETEGHVVRLLDSLIASKLIPPVIAISADAGNSWYVDRHDKMETFYITEFIPYIEEQLELPSQYERVIAGNSAGGYGTLRFSLLFPEMFNDVILLSPAAYNPSPPAISSSRKIDVFAENGTFNDSIWQSYSYLHLVPEFVKSNDLPKFYISVGDDDAYNIVPVVTEIQQTLLEKGIENELRITNGGHDWTCWQQNFSDALTQIFQEVNDE